MSAFPPPIITIASLMSHFVQFAARFKRRVVASARRFLLQEHGHKLREFLPKVSCVLNVVVYLKDVAGQNYASLV